MNPSRDFIRSSFSGLTAARAYPATPRTASSAMTTRAGFPVISNRTFISGWTARRDKLVAAAQPVRSN